MKAGIGFAPGIAGRFLATVEQYDEGCDPETCDPVGVETQVIYHEADGSIVTDPERKDQIESALVTSQEDR